MPADTTSIAEFVKTYRITMSAERVDSNPNMSDSDNMDHWKVVLRRPGHSLTTYFSKGYGHHGAEPTAEEVLDCLSSDSASVENARDFEDWCSDFGASTDSRQAEKTYKACEHTAKRLKNFLDGAYDTLLFHTDSL